jgi:hypothetical protein
MCMEISDLSNTVIKNAYTRKDISRRLRFIRELLEQEFFKGDDKPDVTKFLLTRHATTDDIDAFLSFGNDFYKSFNQDNIYKILKSISETIKKLPSIRLYIPYEPVPAEIIKIGKWFRGNVGDQIILDLHADPTLLGGCAFAYRGVYRDYSLRYYMLKKRDEITRLITQYVNKFYEASYVKTD